MKWLSLPLILGYTLFMFSVRTPTVRRTILKYTQIVEIISLHTIFYFFFYFSALFAGKVGPYPKKNITKICLRAQGRPMNHSRLNLIQRSLL